MLYTVLSEYDIFLYDTKPSKVVDISGGKLEYITLGKNKVVKGLFSTDPAMYLQKDYQPGTVMKGK